MWLDYWGMGGGTKDVLASPAKIIGGGGGGRGLTPLVPMHMYYYIPTGT